MFEPSFVVRSWALKYSLTHVLISNLFNFLIWCLNFNENTDIRGSEINQINRINLIH